MNKSITTFEQALAFAGTEKEKAFFANKELMESIETDEMAYKRLKVITRAINTNPETGKTWTPNWNDSSETKYQPWFEIEADAERPAGFGFSDGAYGRWHTLTLCGSRLCFESAEGYYHAMEHFRDEYLPFILIKE